MIYDDFARWIRERLDTGPYSDDIDAARKLGVPPSTVVRWLGAIRYPTRATTREVATLFDVPIHEVLVAAGYMTPDEAARGGTRSGLDDFNTEELQDELIRRAPSSQQFDDTTATRMISAPLHSPR